jgi:hypothetical protein
LNPLSKTESVKQAQKGTGSSSNARRTYKGNLAASFGGPGSGPGIDDYGNPSSKKGANFGNPISLNEFLKDFERLEKDAEGTKKLGKSMLKQFKEERRYTTEVDASHPINQSSGVTAFHNLKIYLG